MKIIAHTFGQKCFVSRSPICMVDYNETLQDSDNPKYKALCYNITVCKTSQHGYPKVAKHNHKARLIYHNCKKTSPKQDQSAIHVYIPFFGRILEFSKPKCWTWDAPIPHSAPLFMHFLSWACIPTYYSSGPPRAWR